MKIRFDIKAGVQGGVAALIPTGVILLWILIVLGVEPSIETMWRTLIPCAVSFILGMVCFGWKKASEKDKNPAD